MRYREGMVHLKGLRWTIEWLATQDRVDGQSYIILPRTSPIGKGKVVILDEMYLDISILART
jgi:hypothetical protein